MRMKPQYVRWTLAIVLLLLALWAGISCGAVLIRAVKQPYLAAGAVRYHFTGYYQMAVIAGAACIALIAAAAVLLAGWRKNTKK